MYINSINHFGLIIFVSIIHSPECYFNWIVIAEKDKVSFVRLVRSFSLNSFTLEIPVDSSSYHRCVFIKFDLIIRLRLTRSIERSISSNVKRKDFFDI